MKTIERKVVTKVKLGTVNRTKWFIDQIFSTIFWGWRPFGIYRNDMEAGYKNVETGLGAMMGIIGKVETGVRYLDNRTLQNEAQIKRLQQEQEDISSMKGMGTAFATNMRSLMDGTLAPGSLTKTVTTTADDAAADTQVQNDESGESEVSG